MLRWLRLCFRCRWKRDLSLRLRCCSRSRPIDGFEFNVVRVPLGEALPPSSSQFRAKCVSHTTDLDNGEATTSAALPALSTHPYPLLNPAFFWYRKPTICGTPRALNDVCVGLPNDAAASVKVNILAFMRCLSNLIFNHQELVLKFRVRLNVPHFAG